MQPIYLDNAATTPMKKEALEAIHAALWDYATKNGITIEGLRPPKKDIHDEC